MADEHWINPDQSKRYNSFLEAVELLAERANIQPSLSVYENVPMEKQLLLPRKNQDNQKVIAYLSERGIENLKSLSFA